MEIQTRDESPSYHLKLFAMFKIPQVAKSRVTMTSQKGMGPEPAELSVIVTIVESPAIFLNSKILYYSQRT